MNWSETLNKVVAQGSFSGLLLKWHQFLRRHPDCCPPGKLINCPGRWTLSPLHQVCIACLFTQLNRYVHCTSLLKNTPQQCSKYTPCVKGLITILISYNYELHNCELVNPGTRVLFLDKNSGDSNDFYLHSQRLKGGGGESAPCA